MWKQTHYRETSTLPFCRNFNAECRGSANADTSSPSGHDRLEAAQLDVGTLGTTVQRLLQAGLAPTTQRSYMAGKKKYLLFCQETSIPHLPVTEVKLLNLVAYLSNQELKHQTVKCYLSTVRHLQIECGGGDPRAESMLLLALALRSTKREQAGVEKRTRLPITPLILEKLRRVWNRNPSNPDHVMLWAACCVAFFGFLRSGELTSPDVGDFDPGQHLSVSDVTVDEVTNPKVVTAWVYQAVEDRSISSRGVDLSEQDGFASMPSGGTAGIFSGTREWGWTLVFVKGVTPNTSPIGFRAPKGSDASRRESRKVRGHSFRIGAATTAAACGIPIEVIKTLGRWKSQAYQLYIRIPETQLASISRSLAGTRV